MLSGPATINELFNAATARYGDREFLRSKSQGVWSSLTYADVAARVKESTLGLYARGFRRGDHIAIWSENRPEWNIADLAILALGAADVPIYTTQSRSQVEYVTADSGVRAMFVSAGLLDSAIQLRHATGSPEIIISFDDVAGDVNRSVMRLSELAGDGRRLAEEHPDLYEQLWNAAQPDDIATLIYTSGTTGDPKGVMLTHKNLAANAMMNYRWLGLEGRRDLALSYLPLSHIFERGVWYTNMCAGSAIAYAESIDTVAKNLSEIQPTVMTSVPRMFEKIYAKIVERGTSAGFPRRQIFLWSLDVARRWAKVRNRGSKPGFWLSIEHRIADLLVFRKWRDAVGGRVRCFISGGAPLAPDLAYLFTGAGLPILEGYGLTETSPSISCNTEQRSRIGTVGPVIDGVSVSIAPDGEILVKGDTVMAGYYNRPDANREAFTEDGWLRTGDIGYINSDGFLVITDRKKDLIKTSGGKYVAPQPIESMIKSSRFVSQVVVVGNNRKFVSALICPNMELVRSYAKLKGISCSGDDALLAHPRIIDLMERQVEKYTAGLARFEKIKKVALLGHELTVEAGELTPTMKPRRSAIERKYAAVIDAIYAQAGHEVAAV